MAPRLGKMPTTSVHRLVSVEAFSSWTTIPTARPQGHDGELDQGLADISQVGGGGWAAHGNPDHQVAKVARAAAVSGSVGIMVAFRRMRRLTPPLPVSPVQSHLDVAGPAA